jgi:hypothetical protein
MRREACDVRSITRWVCAASLVAALALAAGCGGATGSPSTGDDGVESQAPADGFGGFDDVAAPVEQAPEDDLGFDSGSDAGLDSGDSFQDIWP